MHWANRVANELIMQYPDKDEFVCASGISPSGSVHIGNFREVVTTYFIVKALQMQGKKARFLFSWDDFDRFRKVPGNIDPCFKQYIGMPYSDIPDPYGCHDSYAEHFEKEFEESLKEFDIDAEFRYQSREYKSGRYNPQILHALVYRKEIYDILISFKTQKPSEDERNSFYPITLYCEMCNKDDTHILNFNSETREIEYRCQCGQHGIQPIMEASNIKLNWKIDWPMRWMVEKVTFEPGGRDHSSDAGSFQVSTEIAKEIFNYSPPEFIAYDFIGIKGCQGKMSSSTGNIITPKELLKTYLPDIILFMFSKYKPAAAFNIGLDEDVIRNYTEYERLKARYGNHTLEDEELCYSMILSNTSTHIGPVPKFNQIAGILPLINFDILLLQKVLTKIGEEYDFNALKSISDRAEYWIRNWFPIKMHSWVNEKNLSYYATLNDLQRKWLRDFCSLIRHSWDIEGEQLMPMIYGICHHEEKRVMRSNQKLLFQTIYMLMLNSRSGPPINLLIEAAGIEKTLELLDFTH
ncbi:lysine--tRNA ligase [Vallitalea okinawensis]|uniref:lysine--tRNA ligase n=1 Tax=Vallitalea okinawensis TaxID=2078660 RepID=UPI000CFD9723|nr:lysine--tRNA ligase [Vallitalea okinawensis]